MTPTEILNELSKAITALNTILLGDGNTDITLGGVVKPSVTKHIETALSTYLGAIGVNNASLFETKALMTASSLSDNSFAVVYGDSTSTNNGYYVKKSGSWTLAQWNPSKIAIDTVNATLAANPRVTDFSLGTNNLNTVTTTGTYYQGGSSNATAARNYPVMDAGFLVVSALKSSSTGAVTYAVQKYIPQSSDTSYVFERKWDFRTSTWTPWSKSLIKADLDEVRRSVEQKISAPKDYENKRAGDTKNKIKTSNIRTGMFLSTVGKVASTSDVGWAVTEHIPVTAGAKYTISGVFGSGAYAFFDSNIDGAQGVGYATIPQPNTGVTVTVPAGMSYIVINVSSKNAPTYSSIMLEEGESFTGYVSGDDYYTIKKEAIEGIDDPKDYEIDPVDSSKNLFKKKDIQHGWYLNTSGQLRQAVNWGASGYIPVVEGEYYTISFKSLGYGGISFFSSNTTPLAPLEYHAPTYVTKTVRAPTGAKFMVINLYRESAQYFSDVQVELGINATAYVDGDAGKRIKLDSIYPPVESLIGQVSTKSKMKFLNDTVEVDVSGEFSVKHVLKCDKISDLKRNSVINFESVTIDNGFTKTYSDDVAPIRINSATVGANHGWHLKILTCPSHGKTNADLGSIWSYSGIECVIVRIPDADTICMVRRTSNDNVGGLEFIHVSGAANGSNIIAESSVSGQWYPSVKAHKYDVICDNVAVAPEDRYLPYSVRVVVSESYEVLDREGMVQAHIDNIGVEFTSYNNVRSLVGICNNYVIDNRGGITAEVEVSAINDCSLTDIMAVQSVIVGFTGGSLYYIPKTVPYLLDGKTYDFASMVNVSGAMKPVSNIYIDNSNSEQGANIPDRVVQMGDSYGMAIGYLPVLDSSDGVRRSNNTGKYIYIPSSSLKIYPYLVDKGVIPMNKGDTYSVVGYRNYFKRNPNTTCQYMVKSSMGDYLFLDWHISGSVSVDVPPELMGRKFEIVEKSPNVTLLSKLPTRKLRVSLGSGRSSSYLVLRFL